jgi:gliding motility-associated-like protein
MNVDFSTASDTIPPSGWTQNQVQGISSDLWHFNNPGNQTISYPFTGNFAIFDSQNYSSSGGNEMVSLQSPAFDASIGNNVFLFFDQIFTGFGSDTARVEVYDGNSWNTIAEYLNPTSGVVSEMLDISAYAGGVTNAGLRFTWIGNGMNFWAIDNISIYSPLSLDLGLIHFHSPTMPFLSGPNDIRVSIKNFGANTITSATINWKVDGILQTTFSWTGNLTFLATDDTIILGSYDFTSGDVVDIQIWVENPNLGFDSNSLNDTISTSIASSLCGNFTIGGSNPDYSSFSEAVYILNNAGVSCPVRFLVRDGDYSEQIEIGQIAGADSINTVTFISESEDSSLVSLQYLESNNIIDYTVKLDNSKYVYFQHIGVKRNPGNFPFLIQESKHISISNCLLLGNNSIKIEEGCENIDILNNHFEGNYSRRIFVNGNSGNLVKHINVRNNILPNSSGYCIDFTNAKYVEFSENQISNFYRGIQVKYSDNILINNNILENGIDFGIDVYTNQFQDSIFINGNRISGISNAYGIKVRCKNVRILNNFIHVEGMAANNGIYVGSSSDSCKINFNSISITSANLASSAIFLEDAENLDIRNNIFSNYGGGYAAIISNNPPDLMIDHNNYFSSGVLTWKLAGADILYLPAWQSGISDDANSLNQNPFYSGTHDLSVNQSLLDGTGIVIPEITFDIDSVIRSNPPDVGAKEFDPCGIDAGINLVGGITNPITPGLQNIDAELQNQGTATLTNCIINWSVNGQTQTPYFWSGNLLSAENQIIQIGTYIFTTGSNYIISIWTSQPNNQTDCNNLNDTINTNDMSTPMCGDYTIGGLNPDFANFSEAATILNNAGISCPVRFFVRDGVYSEQIEIGQIEGTNSTNTVTFISESEDSSLVTLQYLQYNIILDYTVKLNNAEYVYFQHLGVKRSYGDNPFIIKESNNISVLNCMLSGDISIKIESESENIDINNNYFEGNYDKRICIVGSAGSLNRKIEIRHNIFPASTNYCIEISYAENVEILQNQISNFYQAIKIEYCDNVLVGYNTIENSENYCIEINSDVSQDSIQIIGNRISGIMNSDGIRIFCENVEIINNFIHINGLAENYGVYLSSLANNCKLYHNAISVTSSNSVSGAVYLEDAEYLDIRNNIFTNCGGGYSVKVEYSPLNLIIDYNNYYSFGENAWQIADSSFQILSAWQAAIGDDVNSLNKNPFYALSTNLSSNQIMLDGAGVSIPEIIIDIDSIIRTNPPDIGAKEFAPCGTDAGINAIVGISNPLNPGIQNIDVELQNQGTSTLTTCIIEWSVNGLMQAPYSWTGSLLSAQNQIVQIGSYNFSYGANYVISVWTSQANNQTDCNNFNDTIITHNLSTPLCGDYTIGGQNPDFSSFLQAVTILNNAGISCPVRFLVRDGVYSEQIEIEKIDGTDSINTVTFVSESEDSSLVSLQYFQSNSILDFTVKLSNSEYVCFQHIGIKRDTGNCPFFIEQSNNISISNCVLSGNNSVKIESGSEHIVISNNYFEENYSDLICIEGGIGEMIQHIEIHNNVLPGSSGKSIELSYVNNVEISNNHINNFAQAIDIEHSNNVLIEYNTIENGYGFGLEISSNFPQTNMFIVGNKITGVSNADGIRILGENVQVVNNFIQTEGIADKSGIFISDNSDNCKLYYNSINVISTNSVSSAVCLDNAENMDIRNNIFSNSGNGYSAILENIPTNIIIDYNNYYSFSVNGFQISGNDYQLLNSWQTAIGNDANSININPFFETISNLRPFQRELNGAGITIPSIIYDIDKELRYQSAPDIGADEFMVDFGITDLLSPTLDCYLTMAENITIYLKQFGDIPFINLIVAYQVNGGQISAETIPGSLANDYAFTFSGSQNLLAYDTYTFKIWIVNSLDDNINNDTLIAVRHSHVPPYVDFTHNIVCEGDTTDFNSLSSVSSGWIEGYHWDFGDLSTSTFQHPHHIFDSSGFYAVTFQALTEVGCFSDTTVDVLVWPTPTADFSFNDICLADTAHFQNLSSISYGSITYFWDFGNNSSSTELSPSHFYSVVDTFSVSLISVSNNACSDTIIHSIIVHELPVLSLPNFDTLFCENDAPMQLISYPTGGIFIGSGIVEDTLYPPLANIGQNTVTYSYADINGCSATISDDFTILPVPEISINGIDSNYCITGSSDTVIIVPAGGVLSGSGINGEIFFPPVAGNGNHTITYTHIVSNGCIATSQFTTIVSEPNIMNLQFDIDSISCYGETDAAINLSVNFSNQSYSEILWSNGATVEDISNLGIGNYSLTVTDSFGCRSFDYIEITQPNQLFISLIAQDAICFAEASGQIFTNIIGGTQPYNFQWSDGSTVQNPTNLMAATYWLELVDANFCTEYDSIEIFEGAEILLSPTIEDILCFGLGNGSIDMTVSGGSPPYTTMWSNAATTEDISNLQAGIYHFLVTDSLGCTDSIELGITQPLQTLSAILSADSLNCFGQQNGSVNLVVSGGTTPYQQFLWSNGMTTQNISGINAGFYYVSVLDANACFVEDSITIFEPDELGVFIIAQDAICFEEASGQIFTNIIGGTQPYSFQWSDGSTVQNPTNLLASTYWLELVDANFCTEYDSIEIFEGAEILLSPTIEDILCFGLGNGSIDMTVSGGSPPYTTMWSNGATTEDISSLQAGIYHFLLTDSLGCTDSIELEITQPLQTLSTILSADSLNCFGQQNGSVNLVVSGGTTPYQQFLWNNGMTTQNISGINAGFYSVSVLDANTCLVEDSITIFEPDEIVIALTSTNVDCYNNATGQILCFVQGGTLPYHSYLWSNGDTTQNLLSVSAGIYTITVIDNLYCTKTDSIEISQPDLLEGNMTSYHLNCYEDSSGQIEVSFFGGTPPYSIVQWSNGASGNVIQNLSAGIFSLSISDTNNCIFMDSTEIFEPDSLSIQYSIQNLSCFEKYDGSINITVSGGTMPISSYLWSNSSQTEDLLNIPAGIYSITITDNNMCINTFNFEVIQPAELKVNIHITNLLCFEDESGKISTNIMGGILPYSYLWSNGENTIDIYELSADEYSLTITDANNCKIAESVNVGQPEDISANEQIYPPSCELATDGSIKIELSGGHIPYSILWFNQFTNDSISQLSAGFYDLYIIDNNDCIKEFEFEVPTSYETCFAIPNVFSPNGDNINDLWLIEGVEYTPDIEVKVYDRYRNIVFKSIGYNVPWDGLFDNKQLPSDAYFYFIDLKNGSKPMQGKVSIIR